MVSWYNHPYYKDHLEKLKFIVEKEYLEHKHAFKDIKIDNYNRLQSVIKKRYGLKALNFSKTKDMMKYADEMFDLFNISYSSLSSFVKITDSQKNFMKNKFLNFINPEYIKFVSNSNDELIGFAVVMPSFANALQKIKGKIFRLGMPVEPGNLILLADIKLSKKIISIIGMPGCAKSRKENGVDWILWRKLCNLKITSEDINHMGSGGLL